MHVCLPPHADQSGPPAVAQSPSERDRTEQIRVALGSSRRHLPAVDPAALRRYYRYLTQNLSLPLVAWYFEPTLTEDEGEYPFLVTELIDPATGLGDESDGIFCKVRKGQHETTLPLIELELPPDDPNYHLVERYWDWLWHCR